MRMSRLFGETLRAAPSGAETAGYQLLLRAGFLRQLGQGIFSYLPLGWRVMRRVEQVMREEMDAAGGVELSMPVVQPGEVWKRSGRFDSVGPELARFTDRRERPLVLAMTNEEVVAALAATEISSWRQLPKLVYHIQIKFRDDPRPRAGLVRAREFTMKDAYSLDCDEEGLAVQYERLRDTYLSIFGRCGLQVTAVSADVGMMGGSQAHEFMYMNPIGEDTVVLCDACGYAQNRQVARAARAPVAPEGLLPAERVPTPDATTIKALCDLLGVGPERTAKVVFMATSDGRFVVAVVRGDMQLNETKLANVLGGPELRPMTEEEIVSIGCVPGYASPIGVGDSAVVAVDSLVADSPNLVAGANEEGCHLLNVNAGRDYEPDFVGDITAVEDGQPCSVCRSPLRTERGVEVGNIFKLGTHYSAVEGATYLAEDGRERPIVMGCYGIGVGRLFACIAEEHHDEAGLCWPVEVAPFAVHLCALGEAGLAAAEEVAGLLEEAGVDVLTDDRGGRAGVQFADADLIGCPVRLTVSKRSLAAGGVEARLRSAPLPAPGEAEVVALEDLVEWVTSPIAGRRRWLL